MVRNCLTLFVKTNENGRKIQQTTRMSHISILFVVINGILSIALICKFANCETRHVNMIKEAT